MTARKPSQPLAQSGAPERAPSTASSATLADHFETLFSQDPDPWGYRTRWYERRKRAQLLASLPSERYANAFEPACANGELSAELAARCDRLLCTDVSAAAVAHARDRLAALTHVAVQNTSIPAAWPDGRFDLIVLSEIGYYLDDRALRDTIERAAASLTDGGTLIASHWRHPEGDYLRSGDEVHRLMATAFQEHFAWSRLLRHEEEDFLVEVWSPDCRSVARREGLRP
ncbi:class I SAM-dependent DNA methyltransferase [Roseateles chitinivorans]|uniref:class I SAM-dependent DNA methyltransferase n=1 Tax=Roseateles chitinivorans TaxID=2917965 RepID=UPI003D66E3F4